MAGVMIAGIKHQLAAPFERLAELDRIQSFAELDIAIKALLSDVSDAHQAAVAQCLVIVLLLKDTIALAIPQPAFALSP